MYHSVMENKYRLVLSMIANLHLPGIRETSLQARVGSG